MNSKNKYGYLFISPFFIVFSIFGVYPILLSLYMSFTDYKGIGSPYSANWVGLQQYARLIKDAYFLQAFINTWKIWGVNIILQLALALILAVIFSDMRLKLKGVSLFRAIFYLPNLMTVSSVALLFLYILDWHHGALNGLLLRAGLISKPVNWLGQPHTAQLAVSLIQTWLWFGHTFIIIFAGIEGISKDYFEAAMIDGANRVQTFFKVTLPLLKPIMIYVVITSLIGGLQLFEIPFLISQNGLGGPEGSLVTMVLYLFNQAFKYRNFGYAAAVAYGLFLIILVFSVIVFKGMFKEEV
ncbi:carbohydrate ABC transporter permease [Thermobrachium celere]|uniref:Sugar ABC transporter, permease protein n=1 Tax=Thermobrachium celere DSM 8682 TaxID=941824 RepID=R7RSK3_9CLOT|nr:sugar ABC transporter permease [Thermobrachium celere]GFR36557.1 sugar ABC transporter ATP-binding protein [Thermobrachium celere]CDF59172.1 sugar ABC transporter, permease protein [Thermobrachium celere DSM 8682]